MTLKHFVVVLLIFSGLLSAPVCTWAQPVKSENIFYMTDGLDALQSFKAHAAQISIIVPAAYHIDQYGTVYGGVDPRVRLA